MVGRDEWGVQRRVAGNHDIRMDGMYDLILRAKGLSVLDIGCNRGMVGYEFAHNGARVVHGCDNYAKGIETAREVFADLRFVRSQFEVVDLTQGPVALRPFGEGMYDLILLLAVVHKLLRIMPRSKLEELLLFLGRKAERWVAAHLKETEFDMVDAVMRIAGLKLVHRSYLSKEMGPAMIWERG